MSAYSFESYLTHPSDNVCEQAISVELTTGIGLLVCWKSVKCAIQAVDIDYAECIVGFVS